MKLVASLLPMVLIFALLARSVAAQEDQDKDSFTGTLIENTSDHLKVSRVVQGKTEDHVFKITAQTKIEGGRLRLRQRIYVRYTSGDNGDTAILVIIRPATTAKKTK